MRKKTRQQGGEVSLLWGNLLGERTFLRHFNEFSGRFQSLFVAVGLLVGAFESQADLVVSVSGVIGSGVTEWTFSGSYDVAVSDSWPGAGFHSFNSRRTRRAINDFDHLPNHLSGDYSAEGTFVPVNAEGMETRHHALSQGATVTGTVSGSHDLDGVFLVSNAADSRDDDWGWYASGAFGEEETLTFSGTGTVALDISLFGEGATAIQNPGDTFTVSSMTEITPLQLQFTAVPEPRATAGLVGCAALGVAMLHRRIKRRSE